MNLNSVAQLGNISRLEECTTEHLKKFLDMDEF